MSDVNSNPISEYVEPVLKVLEGKAFYPNRFFKQVKALYNQNTAVSAPRLAPSLYLMSLFAKIPESMRAGVSSKAALLLVNQTLECPSPIQVRQYIAQAALENRGTNFGSLYEQAKDFLVIPPAQQNIANGWLERVIHTAILRISRERFAMIDEDQWRATVTEVLLDPAIQLSAYQVKSPQPETAIKQRAFKTLIHTNA
jgi:hypothetical protein